MVGFRMKNKNHLFEIVLLMRPYLAFFFSVIDKRKTERDSKVTNLASMLV